MRNACKKYIACIRQVQHGVRRHLNHVRTTLLDFTAQWKRLEVGVVPLSLGLGHSAEQRRGHPAETRGVRGGIAYDEDGKTGDAVQTVAPRVDLVEPVLVGHFS